MNTKEIIKLIALKTNIKSETLRLEHLLNERGLWDAALWYIKTAKIYKSAAINKAENFNREWANIYIKAGVDCYEVSCELRKIYHGTRRQIPFVRATSTI